MASTVWHHGEWQQLPVTLPPLPFPAPAYQMCSHLFIHIAGRAHQSTEMSYKTSIISAKCLFMFSTRAESRQQEIGKRGGRRKSGRREEKGKRSKSCGWVCKGACECLELPLHYLHHILRGTSSSSLSSRRQRSGSGGALTANQ